MHYANPIEVLKNRVKHCLLKHVNISRIHIIGCSRSGTTMLHYSMVAFENMILHNKETSVWGYPSIKESFQLFKSHIDSKKGKTFLVTKRERYWYLHEYITKILFFIKKNNIYVINLIRHPLDVMTSRHRLDTKEYYVEPDFWNASIEAADFLMRSLGDYPNKLTIKFEDVVMHPERIEQLFTERIGLQKKREVKSLRMLKENLALAGPIDRRMIPYMHELRDFDPAAIGRWADHPAKSARVAYLLQQSPYKNQIRQFMMQYGYDDHF